MAEEDDVIPESRKFNGHGHDYASAPQATFYARAYLRAGITEHSDRLIVSRFEDFPQPKIGEMFLATLEDGTNFEIVKVHRVDARTFYVERGQELTQARSWPAGTLIESRVSMDTMYSFNQRYSFDMTRLFNNYMKEPIYVYDD